ncbi:MAG: RecX family transcriptional regulator [Bacilli bacterium]
MIIKKYKKDKLGMYEILLDNNEYIIVHEDLILKYELLLNKNINELLINKLKIENNIYLNYSLALKYLSKKLRSTKEIEDYLQKRLLDNNDISKIIAMLKSNNYLNDSKYAKAYINDHINLTMDGPLKITNNLIKLGISEELILENISVFTSDLLNNKITKLIEKYIKINRNKSSYVLKQYIINNIINLGYKNEDILNILSNYILSDNKDIYEKEYLKLYNKYKNKYSGKDLDNKVKLAMAMKGFKKIDE